MADMCMPSITVEEAGADFPFVHAFFPFDGTPDEGVGAHGSRPWAEGPRNESGQGVSKVVGWRSAGVTAFILPRCGCGRGEGRGAKPPRGKGGRELEVRRLE